MTKDGKPNWVERRVQLQRELQEAKPVLWAEVVKALQDAFASFHSHFPTAARALEFKIENGGLRVGQKPTNPAVLNREEIQVSFNEEQGIIEVNKRKAHEAFVMGVGPDGPYIREEPGDRRLTADELSQHILQHLLFPEGL